MKQFGLVALSFLLIVGAGCVTGTQEDSLLTFSYPDSDMPQSGSSFAQSDQASTDMTTWEYPGVLDTVQIAGKQIRISTKKGDVVFELFADTAPGTVSNFVYLTQGGYYNGLSFHRREEGFVIQGGDPSGNGSGGPGYTFSDELEDDYSYERGIVAMANRGPDTNGSQFFIMLDDTPLPKAYTIFGRVTEGLDVVDEIVVGDVMTTVAVEDAQ
jgi:cyclophilin family peptidyl-prolyl cis-trans isomerase